MPASVSGPEVARHMRRGFVWGVGVCCSAGLGVAWVLSGLLEAPAAVGSIAGFVVALAVAAWVSGYITAPLLELVAVAKQLGRGHLGSRADLGRFEHGEVGLLAHAVNDMATRIETQVSEQRELLAAVSHELRTPLGHMRLLLDHARAAPERGSTFDELEQEIVDIDRLVEQLLACSRVDFGQLRRRRFNVVLLVLRALERHDVDASVLEVEGEDEEAEVSADATLVLAACANLIENAKHHGAGVDVVRVSRRDALVTVEVLDTGPGFDAATQPRVLEPFFRGESRSGGSLGLGLSLVDRIATAHGGQAWARNRLGGGAEVGFTLASAGPQT